SCGDRSWDRWSRWNWMADRSQRPSWKSGEVPGHRDRGTTYGGTRRECRRRVGRLRRSADEAIEVAESFDELLRLDLGLR
ncbi:MAG TPA: hypothetical protein PLV93_03060, partial [Microthrixaceae bacterium]|nr:hypothetical protein [Microthrixaceae bacterium]